MYHNDPSGWGYALMFVGMALFWGLLIVGIVAMIRYLGHGMQTPHNVPSARDAAEKVLAERFARGEVDEAEYRTRLATLRAETAS
jgi:putative membrane protein